jgi:hypothetical protein
VRIVVLTEDTSKDARATVEALVRKMLPLVVSNCRGHDHVSFLPTEQRDHAGMHRCIWKGNDPRDHAARVLLYKYIARRLCESQTFVLFHVDGDTSWENREQSENVQKLTKFVILIEQAAGLGQRNVQRSRHRAVPDAITPPKLDFDGFIPIVPFYTLESWLYQNLQCALDICRREHDGAHVESLRAWESVRHDLDETIKPSEQFCVKKLHNLELAARSYPAETAYEIKKSFFESIERMKACQKLVSALAATIDAFD